MYRIRPFVALWLTKKSSLRGASSSLLYSLTMKSAVYYCTLVFLHRRLRGLYVRGRFPYVTDFNKPSVCISGRARPNAWDFLRRKPSRAGRDRRAVVFLGGFVVTSHCVRLWSVAEFRFSLLRTHTAGLL